MNLYIVFLSNLSSFHISTYTQIDWIFILKWFLKFKYFLDENTFYRSFSWEFFFNLNLKLVWKEKYIYLTLLLNRKRLNNAAFGFEYLPWNFYFKYKIRTHSRRASFKLLLILRHQVLHIEILSYLLAQNLRLDNWEISAYIYWFSNSKYLCTLNDKLNWQSSWMKFSFKRYNFNIPVENIILIFSTDLFHIGTICNYCVKWNLCAVMTNL